MLGANAAVVGAAAGFGELAGYALRSVTGYLADKMLRYWTAAFIGYAINMLAVPALALAGSRPLAAALMTAERTGRAIRRPSVETTISLDSVAMAVGALTFFSPGGGHSDLKNLPGPGAAPTERNSLPFLR